MIVSELLPVKEARLEIRKLAFPSTRASSVDWITPPQVVPLLLLAVTSPMPNALSAATTKRCRLICTLAGLVCDKSIE